MIATLKHAPQEEVEDRTLGAPGPHLGVCGIQLHVVIEPGDQRVQAGVWLELWEQPALQRPFGTVWGFGHRHQVKGDQHKDVVLEPEFQERDEDRRIQAVEERGGVEIEFFARQRVFEHVAEDLPDVLAVEVVGVWRHPGFVVEFDAGHELVRPDRLVLNHLAGGQDLRESVDLDRETVDLSVVERLRDLGHHPYVFRVKIVGRRVGVLDDDDVVFVRVHLAEDVVVEVDHDLARSRGLGAHHVRRLWPGQRQTDLVVHGVGTHGVILDRLCEVGDVDVGEHRVRLQT